MVWLHLNNLDCSLLTHQPTCTQPCKHTNSNSAGYSAGRSSPLFLSSKLRAAVQSRPRVTSLVLVYLDGFRINSGLKGIQIFVSVRPLGVIAPPRPQRTKTASAAATRPPIQTYPAVDDGHVKRVGVEPALHGFADGADLVQRRGVHVRPARIQSLKADQSPIPPGHTRSQTPTAAAQQRLVPNSPWGSSWRGRAFSPTG